MDSHNFLHDSNGQNSSIGGDMSSPTEKLNYRREIEMRKAREKEMDQANYTFKPKITHKSKQPDPPNTPRENRFDKLYGDALKRHITSHLREDQRDRGHSFAPKIHSRSGSTSRTRDASAERSTAQSTLDTRQLVERLTTPRRPKKEVAVEDPSFTPTISKRAQSIETLGSQEVAKRLYEHSKMMQEKLELKRNESEQKARDSCPFSPNLITKRSSSAQRARRVSSSSIVSRSQRFEEEKQHRLEEARKQKAAEELAEVTFKPQLVATKRPTTPSSRLPVHERLAVPLDKSVSPQVALAYSDYTFHPKLHTKRGPSPARYSAEYANIHDRLFHEGLARQQELQEERATLRQSMESELTFKPQINASSSNVSHIPVFQRLSSAVHSPEKTQRIQAEMTRDWTFSPVLSTGTQRIAQSITTTGAGTVFDRLAEEERVMREENERRLHDKQAKEEEEFRKLTFAPALPSKSLQLFSRSTDGSDVYTRLNQARTVSKSGSSSVLDLASIAHDSVVSQDTKRIVKDEQELRNLFERLSATHTRVVDPEVLPPPEPTPKKVVLPKENVDAIVDRLAKQRTQSFILKHDTEESEQIIKQHSLLKEVPKIRAGDLDHVLDRLRGHTLSTATSVDLKTLSRSMSIDGGASVMSNLTPNTLNTFNLPSPPSVLQQTLARRMGRADRSFVETLETSLDPALQSIPRSLSRDASPFFSHRPPLLPNTPEHDEVMSVSTTPSRAMSALHMIEEIHEQAEEKRRADQRRYSFRGSQSPAEAARHQASEQHSHGLLPALSHSLSLERSASLERAASPVSAHSPKPHGEGEGAENAFLQDPSLVRPPRSRSKSPTASRLGSRSFSADDEARETTPAAKADVSLSYSDELLSSAQPAMDFVFDAKPLPTPRDEFAAADVDLQGEMESPRDGEEHAVEQGETVVDEHVVDELADAVQNVCIAEEEEKKEEEKEKEEQVAVAEPEQQEPPREEETLAVEEPVYASEESACVAEDDLRGEEILAAEQEREKEEEEEEEEEDFLAEQGQGHEENFLATEEQEEEDFLATSPLSSSATTEPVRSPDDHEFAAPQRAEESYLQPDVARLPQALRPGFVPSVSDKTLSGAVQVSVDRDDDF